MRLETGTTEWEFNVIKR